MQEDLKKIHNASMHVLENCGIKIMHPEILELVKENGIRVHEETVYFTECQLMSCIKKAPSSFNIYARNPKYDIAFGGGTSRIWTGLWRSFYHRGKWHLPSCTGERFC